MCTCIEQMEEKLRAMEGYQGIQVDATLPLFGNPAKIYGRTFYPQARKKGEPRRLKAPIIVPIFCMMCGERYLTDKEREAKDGAKENASTGDSGGTCGIPGGKEESDGVLPGSGETERGGSPSGGSATEPL